MKERFTVQASSLGDYFGVGFNSIQDRIAIDLGEKEKEVLKDELDRMKLGQCLESGILDYYEYLLGVSIFNRNTETLTFMNDMVRGKIDGECIYNGEPTIVECKDSNSANSFTDSMGYQLQCQSYMEAKGYKQALLLGLQNGVPSATLIRYDEELVKDIYTVVEHATAILSGIETLDDYCWDIVNKYKNEPEIREDMKLSDDDKLDIEELVKIKASIKELKEKQDEIETKLKGSYTNAKYEDDKYSIKITTSKRAGGYNMDMIKLTYPDIDFDRFKKQDSVSQRITIRKK